MTDLHDNIALWWDQKLNTNEMAKLARLPEWRLERVLHEVLENRRKAKAVRQGMGMIT